MNVVLDTNIFKMDFVLRSTDFEVLQDYLQKTKSEIILPQVVIDETTELYRRTLSERSSKYRDAANHLNLMFNDQMKHVPIPIFDFEQESKAYIDYIKKKLNIKDKSIIAYDNDHLRQLTERAIKRIRPINPKGEGFRDALIWLTIRDYTDAVQERQIIFISNNDGDFGKGDKTELHDTLQKECDELEIKVHYYRSLKDFVEKHSSKIGFIDEKWLESHIDDVELNDLVTDRLNDSHESMQKHLQQSTEGESSGYYRVTNANNYAIPDFTVYEKLDGTQIVNATFECEIEIEYEYVKNQFYRDWNAVTSGDNDPEIGYMYSTIQAYYAITIKDSKVTQIDLEDFWLSGKAIRK